MWVGAADAVPTPYFLWGWFLEDPVGEDDAGGGSGEEAEGQVAAPELEGYGDGDTGQVGGGGGGGAVVDGGEDVDGQADHSPEGHPGGEVVNDGLVPEDVLDTKGDKPQDKGNGGGQEDSADDVAVTGHGACLSCRLLGWCLPRGSSAG